MVAAVARGLGDVALHEDGAPELPAPEHDRIVQQAALLQVRHQGGGGLIRVAALQFQLRAQVAVLIPAGVHQLHEAHAALDQAARQQAVAGERAVAMHVRAVHLQNGLRLFRDVEQVRHAGLHFVRHLVLRDARLDLRVAVVRQAASCSAPRCRPARRAAGCATCRPGWPGRGPDRPPLETAPPDTSTAESRCPSSSRRRAARRSCPDRSRS